MLETTSLHDVARERLRTWRTWGPTCGTHRSRFSDLPLGARTCPRSSNVVWPMKRSCGMPSQGWPTCNVRGRSYSSALDPVATTCCALFHRLSLTCMRRGTMEALLGTIPGDDSQIEMARHITRLPSRWEDWSSDLLRGWHQPLTGPPGRMPSQYCNNAFPI